MLGCGGEGPDGPIHMTIPTCRKPCKTTDSMWRSEDMRKLQLEACANLQRADKVVLDHLEEQSVPASCLLYWQLLSKSADYGVSEQFTYQSLVAP